MKLTVITVSSKVLESFIDVYQEFKNKYPGHLELRLFSGISEVSGEKLWKIQAAITDADMVIIDLMGSSSTVSKAVLDTLDNYTCYVLPIGNSGRQFLRLGTLQAMDIMGMGMMKKPISLDKMRDLKNLKQIDIYWKNGNLTDISNMMLLLLKNYGGCEFLPEPAAVEELKAFSIQDPKTKYPFTSYEEYKNTYSKHKEKPVVALLYYGHNYPNDSSICVAAVMEKLRDFAQILPIAFGKISGNEMTELEDILLNGAWKKTDIAINFLSFRLGAGPMGGNAQEAVDMLERLNIPVMHPYFMTRRSEEEWKQSLQGASASEFIISVMLPELDGCIETYPVGSLERSSVVEDFDFELSRLMPIEERIDKLAARVKRWLNLKNYTNKEKKIAVIGYNYPPGESNVFGGAFLDTFASVESILRLLKSDGYTVEPLTSEQLRERFLLGGLVNSPQWSDQDHNHQMIKYNANTYKNELQSKAYREALLEAWGEAPGEIMTSGNDFLIPGIINENVFVGLQPARGIHENPEKAYHDKSLPPHHQYVAFYQWLRDEFQADAVIHVGTHGTLEFLRGKECGMSEDCFPDQLMGDLPHIYLYYLGNPAEAMIAKRRAHALLVSYQSPAFMESGLYGEITELAALIDEYHNALMISPARGQEILKKIMETAEKNHLPQELDELEKELYTMKRSLVPEGLHCFNKQADREEAAQYASFVLRYDRDHCKSIRRILAEDQGLDYEMLLEQKDTKPLEELDARAAIIWEQYISTGEIPPLAKEESHNALQQSLVYGKNLIEIFRDQHEGKGLLKALSGEYLKAQLAGDFIRNPEVLPSGYNLYQFDPRFIPTATAYSRGAKIAENTLKKYKESHGHYPSSTAVILWGLETSRTQGETIGQILAYLGVEVVRGQNVWEPAFRIIPQSELKRPRIDVVINICGFFRDMFPNMMESINDLLEKIKNLDEPDEYNYYRNNYNRIYKMLLEAGYPQEEASELAASRIFGPGEAEYGTGITKLLETGNWEEESQIGSLFVSRLNHIYSKNYRGRFVEGLLEKNLSAVDIVSQVRSNHEYEITDLDHYYEFFGGLAKSVELAKGEKCEIYISDTTTESIATENVEHAIARGVRTRLINPRWIDGMLKHQYHGGQKIQERFENMLGLSATTNRVDSQIFSSLHNTYISAEEMRKRMSENNPWAYMSILEKLMEANDRGYWDAEDKELDELKQLYLELEGSIEETVEGS